MMRDHLTDGEIACIRALHASGATRKFIARKMGLSTRTVRLHEPIRKSKQRKIYDPIVPRVRMLVGEWYLDEDGCMTRVVQCKSNG